MFEFSYFGYFRSMSDSRQDKPTIQHAPFSPKVKTNSLSRDHIEAELEDAVEELTAAFGAGPRAAPHPEGPKGGQQLSP